MTTDKPDPEECVLLVVCMSHGHSPAFIMPRSHAHHTMRLWKEWSEQDKHQLLCLYEGPPEEDCPLLMVHSTQITAMLIDGVHDPMEDLDRKYKEAYIRNSGNMQRLADVAEHELVDGDEWKYGHDDDGCPHDDDDDDEDYEDDDDD